MLANYHTHTPRCRHACGAEESYIQAAIDSGMQILGFSDHTPYWFGCDYYSTMRMYPEQLPDYIETISRLKAAYADKLQLHLGLEAEYYPGLFPELYARLKDTPIEYLLLGQHWVGNEIGEAYNARPTDSEEQLRRYCDQVIDAMQTGLFAYIAHPDLLYYTGPSQIYEQHMVRLCREAKSCGIPLELNLLGLRDGKNYPDPRFWALAAQECCQVVLGCDAHQPEDLCRPDIEAQALEMVRFYGLELLETIPLKRI